MTSKRSLKELLEVNHDDLMDEDSEVLSKESKHDQSSDEEIDESLCVECGDQPHELLCLDCDEHFCSVCFDYLHRTGKRKQHKVKRLAAEQTAAAETPTSDAHEEPCPVETAEAAEIEAPDAETAAIARFKDNTSFIPMRLTAEERKLFRLLEAALNVSEYTDKIDVYSYSSKAKRIVQQLKEMCTVLTGLVVANGMEEGQRLMDDKEFVRNADWYQTIFEIGRRYKIMNPERMRATFGKLMYMIMDSRLPEVKDNLEFDLYKPILTVQSFLEQHGGLELLDDPLVFVATMEIRSEGRSRLQVQKDIKQKELAIERLARKYSSKQLPSEGVRQALYSVGDYHAYLSANRTPVRTMIERLKQYFNPETFENHHSLGISAGSQGARLSHNHRKQYQYVLQSLTLWSELMRDMYKLWSVADADMTSDKIRYQLADTGQGLNRIKACPSVHKVMHNVIARAQRETGSWVGSSVVHLGDRAVPNALFFLDKYLQVPRILNPVNTVLTLLDSVLRDPFAYAWAESQFGSVDSLKKTILVDFFRHAFDGSGSDNFYDAGSCIDGRLTSAWNWANLIAKKPYYKMFLICGFTGFDGSEGF
ncbi:hypothetical protein B9G98_02977 [Wickerhamiella sorbophila]|uniref:B box-type domain-containing protein n=1 Tax=Wickerhamiella sorbophila TaxID=45607 RepID=A0A2T0FK64_9ASCO|nr:hypothetical protein B9G98_02977 [Wickerhamiella sorbophila]PRT55357.1 hypothetical protein B9G98_02977 [Wickerhamiella sorbophila]